MVTGHRPNKIGGYSTESPLRKWVNNAIRFALKSEMERMWQLEKIATYHKTPKEAPPQKTAITGMALGVDQAFAEVALELEWSVQAFVPGRWQPSKWPEHSREAYFSLLRRIKAAHTVDDGFEQPIIVCSDADYNPSLLHHRNTMMVEACDVAIAVWDGSEGGTHDAVMKLARSERPIYHINPAKRSLGWWGKVPEWTMP